ncbi:NAD-P-binding protein [Stereum hirsutum FP-91666 SS1]|uniref:NAD-P-binding protein n=1 Tax=Stereum hirsutum (strain FP-91666) TaxID=721885 RepID=UPI000440F277|nr:NAD-P-binding protein [Stereum hirsutum FP-91666 SS1]EIM87345.1 NAD-P-binding protein [Stereum hirsutum FP-91666 SS1]
MPRLTPGGVPSFLYSQFFVTPKLDRNLSFAGQTVIVTGSNTGLGFSAAQQIAERGASKVILAVRTISKGEAAAQKLRDSLSQSQHTSTKIEVWPLNLSSYQSVKDFAARVNTLDRLDVLLENAGVVKVKFELEEGNEATITTNVISTTLLALLVLPKLRETAEKFGVTPRLTIVSSEVAFWSSFEERKAENIFDKLNDPNSNMQDRYNLSKLLENFIVRELATRISASASTKPFVIVNTLNPGFCESTLRREVSGFQGAAMAVSELLLQRKTAVGARTLVHAASTGRESHGKYLSDCQVHPSPLDSGKWGDEDVLRTRIWNELISKLEKIEPGISQNI